MPLPPRGMPPQMPPQASGAGGPIDDLISAQMMQSAVGNPNAPVPAGKMVGRQQRPAIPVNKQPSPKAGNAQQKMIQDIFRKQAGKGSSKNARPPTR